MYVTICVWLVSVSEMLTLHHLETYLTFKNFNACGFQGIADMSGI
jgi:hypothetical protein